MSRATDSSGPLAMFVEFFTLGRARRVVAKLDARDRKQLARSLLLGRQKADASDTLWANGHSAEALRLATEALEATLGIARAYASAMQLPVAGATEREIRATALRDRGASEREIAGIESAIDASRAASLPTIDASVTPALDALYVQLARARNSLDRRFHTARYGRDQITRARSVRVGATMLVVAAMAVALYVGTRRPEYTVSASAVWAHVPMHDESKAVDDRTDTLWVLPDGEPGWLEVRFATPRHVDRVRLLNSANPPHMDRGTHEYRVEIHSHGGLVRTIDGAFGLATHSEWAEHDVDLDDVERIRFVVESHHRLGAGLAELDWE